MTTINVDSEDLREGDHVVLRGDGWVMTGRVIAPFGVLDLGPIKIMPGDFISATRYEVSTLPTEPGAYADKDGDPWLLDGNGYWGDVHGHWRRAADAVQHGPFTRLRPDPVRPERVVRADVEAEIVEWLRDEGYSWAATRVERGDYR